MLTNFQHGERKTLFINGGTKGAAISVFVGFNERITKQITNMAKVAGRIKLEVTELPIDKIQITSLLKSLLKLIQ